MEGISIADVSESAFLAMDQDGDGTVTFHELLRMTYPAVGKEELQTMLSWVAPKEKPPPPPPKSLSEDAKKQIKGIFKAYDKDKSGKLSLKELQEALKTTGCAHSATYSNLHSILTLWHAHRLEKEEIGEYFLQHDFDGNGEIDIDEFTNLMDSTGAFEED
jgi:Ca2+-binding EF-hand superfamily protein